MGGGEEVPGPARSPVPVPLESCQAPVSKLQYLLGTSRPMPAVQALAATRHTQGGAISAMKTLPTVPPVLGRATVNRVRSRCVAEGLRTGLGGVKEQLIQRMTEAAGRVQVEAITRTMPWSLWAYHFKGRASWTHHLLAQSDFGPSLELLPPAATSSETGRQTA